MAEQTPGPLHTLSLMLAAYNLLVYTTAEGLFRWTNRVGAYAFLLVTDRYPPFRLS